MRRGSVPLAGLDLNLLVILRELLRERNVTRAAERVGVTQPAASAALGRLRRHFGDELLERTRGGYVLTPLGDLLAAQIDTVCGSVEKLFATDAAFHPADSEREFSVLTFDYVVAALGESLSRTLYAAAPGVRLDIKVPKAPPPDLPETLRVLDAMIAAPSARFATGGIRSRELFRDRWVCVVDADNPVGDRLELADLERLPWVVPYHPDGGYPAAAPLGPLLAQLSGAPRVAVRVDSYTDAAAFVAGTGRIAVMQQRLTRHLPGLRVLECPGDPPPIVEMLWWHAKNDDDEAHRWFRSMMIRAAAQADPRDRGDQSD